MATANSVTSAAGQIGTHLCEGKGVGGEGGGGRGGGGGGGVGGETDRETVEAKLLTRTCAHACLFV